MPWWLFGKLCDFGRFGRGSIPGDGIVFFIMEDDVSEQIKIYGHKNLCLDG